MPVTKTGLVYYADDPERKVFRKVYPAVDDSELDDPRWTTVGVDSTRQAVLVKVDSDSVEAMAGFAGTP